MNHGISRRAFPRESLPVRLPAPPWERPGFIDRFVFPDGELHEVGTVVSVIQQQDLEVRHVESLREHYALTLRAWVANLEAHWDEAVDLAGLGRARVWRLYMAASAVGFETGAHLDPPGPGGEARPRPQRLRPAPVVLMVSLVGPAVLLARLRLVAGASR